MKKISFFLLAACAFSFASCREQKSSGAERGVPVAEIASEAKEEPVPAAEIDKLRRVLSSMTERCKNAVPNGNPAEFLADLYEVLESETAFSSDDLSPFYLIDKTHFVSENYEPLNLVPLVTNDSFVVNKNTLSLRPEAAAALKTLGDAAAADGVRLTISSSYRSYEYQKNLFNYWVSVDGLAEAERESARPGTSQHQLGMAVDFAPVDDAFAETEAGKWVYKNAARYGWSLSFPHGYEDVTGYRWESWHFRYIGTKACAFQKKWFSDIQQFMIEFIDEWKSSE